MSIGKLIAQLEPGKHFLGLWVYRQHSHRKKQPKWTVTLWDRNNEYCETALYNSPAPALREAYKILNGGKHAR